MNVKKQSPILAQFSVATKSEGALTKIIRKDPDTGEVIKDESQCAMSTKAGTSGKATLNSHPQDNTLLNAFQVWLSTIAPLVNMPVWSYLVFILGLEVFR